MTRKRTTKQPAEKPIDQDQWCHWWKESPIMKRDKYGHYVAQEGAEFWFKHYAEPRMLYAWIYELCRRIALLRNAREEDKDLARQLPRYDLLPLRRKEALYQALRGALAARGHAVLSRQADRGQVEKLGDWRVIEAFDARQLADADGRLRRAKQYIKKYWEIVAAALVAWNPPHLAPELPHHELTGIRVSRNEFLAIVEEANSKFPPVGGASPSELFPSLSSAIVQPQGHEGPKKPNVFLKALMRPVARHFP